MIKTMFSDIVIKRSLDADFQTKMEGVQFSTTPREVVTVRDVENNYLKLRLIGGEESGQ